MGLSERLAYIMTLDAKGAVKGFQDVGAAADKSLGQADAKVDRLGGNLTKFGAGAVAVAGVAAVGLVKLGQSASDLGESVNAVNVTFKDAAGGVLELGENAAKSVGLSKTEFNGLAVQFSSFATTIAGEGGDVVATLDDLTTRGADFASVMNMDVNEAMALFQSGLAGESEPLRKYGLDVSAAAVETFAYANGIAEAGAKLTEAQKIQARYGLIMEQTAKTQGDFANTADSFANRQRVLNAELENAKAAIGQGVLPMMEALLGVVSKVTGAFSSLSPETQSMIGKFAALGTVGVGLIGTLSLVAGQVIKMRTRFKEADGTLTGFGKAAAGVGVALGVASVALLAYSLNAAEAARNTQQLKDNADELSKASDSEALEVLRETLVGTSLAGRELSSAFATMAEANLEGTKRALDLATAAGMERDVLAELKVAIWNEEKARRQQVETTEQYTSTVEGSTEAVEGQTEAQTEAEKIVDAVKDAVKDLIKVDEQATRVIDALTEVIDAAKEADEEFRKSIQETSDNVHTYEQAVLGMESAYAAYQAKVAETTETVNSSAASDAEKEQALRDLRSAELDTASTVAETAKAYAAEQGAVDGSNESFRLQIDFLTLMKQQFPELRDEINDYIRVLNNIPQARDTRITVNGGGVPIPRAGLGRGYASGTDSATEGWHVVGENGPELAHFDAGGKVIPNHELRNSGSGGAGVTFNVTVNAGMGSDGRLIGSQIVQEIQKWERFNGRGWRM
jgi:hypothetical protein